MVNYRRSQTPGGSYFFTVNLHNRRAQYLVTHIYHLRQAFRMVRKQRPFKIAAIAVMPDHLHAILTLPEDDHDYSGRWRAIKSHFTRSLVKAGVDLSKNDKGEYKLWQRRFWEHLIRDEDDLHRHIDYIHFNPVKHGYVVRVRDWPHSSFHRYVKTELLDENWGHAAIKESEHSYGE